MTSVITSSFHSPTAHSGIIPGSGRLRRAYTSISDRFQRIC